MTLLRTFILKYLYPTSINLMSRNIKVLLVDDNRSKDFFEPLADSADNVLNCELVQAYTWEDASKILDEAPFEYHGLILDGKGQKAKTTKPEDDSFLKTVLTALRDKAAKNYYLPYVIYSGWADELKKYNDDEPIFWKGKGEEEKMFFHLKELISGTEYHKCRQLYPDIFELFDLKIINSKYVPDMVNLVNFNYNTFVGNSEIVFRCLRPILENTFYELNKLDDNLVAPKFFHKGTPNISGIIWYLAGSHKYNKDSGQMEFNSDRVISLPLYYLVSMLQDVTSSTAMHHFDTKPSDYLIRSCTNALLEYLLWYKQFVKANYIR